MLARLALSVSLLVAASLGLTVRAHGAEVADAVSVSATVKSIDLASRTVVLTGAEGKTESVVVPEGIANLDKLKVGDTVNITYGVALAVQILKPGEEAGPAAVSAAGQGGGEVIGAKQINALLKVDAVDLATNSVTLTGPEGNTETVKVKRPELQAKLKTLKPGDQVQITYTEAVAIKVEPKAK